jgi:acetyl esterase/lipase
VDPEQIVIGGDSAGGGLAAATVLLVRERGGPRLVLQMLISPMLDDRDANPSLERFAADPLWSRGANRLGWRALLRDKAGEAAEADRSALKRAPR